ncbi:MAG: DUF58 domain-containing protein [Anaerolineales bacterium]|uniref:DUF58 domain-containing protein n=1 Tax=Candidatus Villigracilis vicinus TaxID=3140679 RepID=UPI003136B00D|nr:DUF58 domain-containing protein [Anaerolineales bacterium]
MKAGRILVALLFVVGGIGVLVSGATIYSRFLYSSAFLVLFSWAWTRWVIRGVVFERSSRELRANVGDVLEESYRISNRGRLPMPWVEILNHSTIPFAAGSRLFTLLMGKQRRNYTARTWLTRRGSFQLGPTRITVGDPFGLFTSSREFQSKDTLIVFPMIHEIRSFPTPQGVLTGGQVIRKKSPDVTPHAAGVREYVHGDAMKRIHWPSSARRNRLMVKEFEQDPQAELWIYLDLQQNIHYQQRHKQQEIPFYDMLLRKRPKIDLPPSTLEYSVSIAASLAHYFLNQRRAVGFASAGQTYNVLPAERSERQEAKILETLAFVKADGTLSLAGLVSTQAALLPQGSSVILITPTTRPTLLQAVDDLQLRYLSPIVVLLDVNTFGGPTGTDVLISALKDRRVPVIPIACEDDLPQALSEISSNFKLQELRQWQTPELSLSI